MSANEEHEHDQRPEDGEHADVPSEPSDGGHRLDRRGFLAGAGGVVGAAAFEATALGKAVPPGAQLTPSSSGLQLAQQIAGLLLNTKPSFTTLLRRREDFLFLRVEGYNLHRQGQYLVRVSSSRAAYLVIEHLPQALAEEAYGENAAGSPAPPAPGVAKGRLAYPSRLAFSVPKKVTKIPLTVAGLLDWAKLEPSLTPVADEVAKRSSKLLVIENPTVTVSNPTISTPVLIPIHIPGVHGESELAKTPPKPTASKPTTNKPATATRPATSVVIKKPPKIRVPTATETAIELPLRLVLSPLSDGRWSHIADARTLDGWTEQWRTRLTTNPDPNSLDGASIRAVWNYDTRGPLGKPSLDYKTVPPATSGDDTPFLEGLGRNDRYQIVRGTSDFTLSGRADVAAHRLWLTSRGGFLDSRGVWDQINPKDPAFDLAEWRHVTTLGRDQYVKVVHKGYLYPFGHPAVLVTITERRFEKSGSRIIAASRQIKYIAVKQFDRSYDKSKFGVTNDSLDLPFRAIHVSTQRTPILDPNAGLFSQDNPNKASTRTLFPIVLGTLFQFHCIGTDWVGRQIPFTTPLLFVDQADAYGPIADRISGVYNTMTGAKFGHPVEDLYTATVGGKTVAFGASAKQGDTDLETHTVQWKAKPGASPNAATYFAHDQLMAFPALRSAQVRLSAAEQATGGATGGPAPQVAFHDTYVNNGGFATPANPGNLFMQLLGSSLPAVQFGGNGNAGGVMTPNLLVSGLSRTLGPVAGDLGKIAGASFDPKSVFAGLEARILGGVKLLELIAERAFSDADSSRALKITYDTSGTQVTTHLAWTPDIADNPVVQATTPGSAHFELDGLITADPAHPENTTFAFNGKLTGFTVYLMSSDESDAFIGISFNSLTFDAKKGQKSDVKVDIQNVAFLGVLEFVEQLESFLDFSGDGGPKIEVLPTGISADLAVPIPDIAVGVFALTNIEFDAGFNLPFNGDPARFRFGFSTRDNPFALSVAIFGGGGFFGIAIGTDGVEMIEASLDFGAMCAIDLGVASGSVHLLAGIYFSYGKNDDGVETCVLSGFVKLGGSLSILGIISISLEFDMSITFQTPPAEVTGTATLTVSISVLFFSFSASVSASKTFGGGNDGTSVASGRASAFVGGGGPPTFIDQVPPDTPGGTTSTLWNTYCDAFASN